jgi:hypothetical protein
MISIYNYIYIDVPVDHNKEQSLYNIFLSVLVAKNGLNSLLIDTISISNQKENNKFY